MIEHDDVIKRLEERVAKLERQVAVLQKQNKSAPARGQSRESGWDRYDALEYPER